MLGIVWEFWQWGNGELWALLLVPLLIAGIFAVLGAWTWDYHFAFVGLVAGAVVLAVLFPFVGYANEGRLEREAKQRVLKTYFTKEYDLDVSRVILRSNGGVADTIHLRSSCGNIHGYELFQDDDGNHGISTDRIWSVKQVTRVEIRGGFRYEVSVHCPLPHEEVDMPG